jgi:hypothetical protein
VNDLSSQVMDAKAFVSARMSEMERALDGFPAAVLLDDCLKVDGSGCAVDRRAQALVAHILTEWACTIERDLQRFPPASIEVLQTIRQRMIDAREALLRLRSLLDELSEFAPNRAEPAEPTEWPRADTRGSGAALPNVPNPFEREGGLAGYPRRANAPVRWPSSAATSPPAYQTASARA